jgi:hypothetical protein
MPSAKAKETNYTFEIMIKIITVIPNTGLYKKKIMNLSI